VTTAAALSLALLSIAVVVATLGLAIVVVRTARRVGSVRRARRMAPVRPILLRMLADDDQESAQDALARLLVVDARTWSALEPTVSALLGKLRGGSHDLLRSLVELRGTVARARRRTRRIGAVGRARAAELLGGLEDPHVTEDLVLLLADRDPEVRQVAARALGRSGDSRAAGDLLGCLSGGSVPPRVVAQALLRLGPGAEQALVEALAAPDELVRAVSVEILGLSSAVGASRAIELSLGDDSSLEVRIRAARSLGRLGMPSALGALVRAAGHDQPAPLRAVAARALGDLGHPDAVPHLRVLLRDPVHRVASNAGRALAQLGPTGVIALRREIDVLGGPGGEHARDALSRVDLSAALTRRGVAREMSMTAAGVTP
jgi:HEAT repeat protein